MKIEKQASVLTAGVPDEQQLEQINKQSKSPLEKDDVYVFSVRLCDDQADRDFERFATDALSPLAQMFIGKTGIVDRNWSSEKQMARIFDAGVEYEGGAAYIKAWAYILRSEKSEDVIREIEGGIKKEVSVGCSMKRSICSVCGADYGSCEHRKGTVYGSDTCVAVLCEPVDAYEFSFVAVPAQKQAGVLKAFGAEGQAVDAKLLEEAELGRRYRKELESETVRLGLMLDISPDAQILGKMVSVLNGEELADMKKKLASIAAKRYPPVCQLPGNKEIAPKTDSAFLI
ncbi:MAG: hypothetical protein IIY04_00465 [Oscillospiraceae bacterium]|nr:hypothetical protein [Oscillospiraceae bacterium]